MRILIISKNIDVHADAVIWGLEQFGYVPTLWDWENFPRCSTGIFISSDTKSSTVNLSVEGRNESGDFDVIWVRRAFPPRIEDAHPDDKEVIEKESLIYLQSLMPFLGHKHTLWINDFSAEISAGNKLWQLDIAKSMGFSIPETLVSNDYDAVSRFVEHHSNVVFKGFSSGFWLNDDKSMTVRRTSLVTKDHIRNKYAVESCPGIYQELILKKYELRVIVMGNTVITAKLDTQKFGKTIDSRYDVKNEDVLSIAEISDSLKEQCIELTRAMGLQYGAIDLIIDEDGNAIFLEINHSGQFLYLEHFDHRISALDAFCRFIASKDTDENRMHSVTLLLADYYASNRYAACNELENSLRNQSAHIQST